MRHLKLGLAISMFSLAFSGPYFSDDHLNVIMSLAEYFNIAFCVFGIEKRITGAMSHKRHFSKKKLLTTTYIEGATSLVAGVTSPIYVGRTMVVMRMSNETLILLRQLFEDPRNISISSVVWVLFAEESLQLDSFKNINIPFDCEFLYVYQNTQFFSLTEIYNIGEDSDVETYYLGQWTKEGSLDVGDPYLFKRRTSFKGYKFQGVIKNDPPYVMIEKDDGGNFDFRGFLFEFWRELEIRLNFTTEFSSKYFEGDPKTILKNREVDFAVARISIHADDFKEMDFSYPVGEARTYLFGHRPGAGLDWDSYLKPFSSTTWLVNLTWMISSALTLAFLYKIAWNFGTSEREADYFIFTLSESILTVLRAICNQGSDNTPRSASCRLFFLSIYLSALVATSAFSAALFSLLTVPKPRYLFRDAKDVLANKRFKIGLPSDADFLAIATEFSNSNSSSRFRNATILSKLLKSAEKVKVPPQKGIERLCHEQYYVFMFDLPSVLNLMQTLTISCREKILFSGPPLFTNYISFGFTRNNPYRKLIDYHITKMRNDGILRRIELNYWPPEIPTVPASWVRVTLSDISPILYMFLLGLILGIIILYIEKIIYHLKKKTGKRRHAYPSDVVILQKQLNISNYPKFVK